MASLRLAIPHPNPNPNLTQTQTLSKDVGAAEFFGLAARGNGSADEVMYVSEKMHLPPYSTLLSDAVPRAFLSGAADLPERGRQANVNPAPLA